MRDFYNDEEIRKVYYPAAESFIRATLRADRVVIFDHTVRRRVDGAASTSAALARASRRPRSMSIRPTHPAPIACASICLRKQMNSWKGRVQVVNLWRPIRGPLRDLRRWRFATPPALLRTISSPLTLIYPNRRGETYSVKFNSDHRWFYFPEMTADQALLLKCYDLRTTDGRARFAPHTAFVDPTTPKDASATGEHRTARTLVFHADDKAPQGRAVVITRRRRSRRYVPCC